MVYFNSFQFDSIHFYWSKKEIHGVYMQIDDTWRSTQKQKIYIINFLHHSMIFFNIHTCTCTCSLPCGPLIPPSVLQCLDSYGIEALILILDKVLNCRLWLYHWSDTASHSSVSSCWRTENSQMQTSQPFRFWGRISVFLILFTIFRPCPLFSGKMRLLTNVHVHAFNERWQHTNWN